MQEGPTLYPIATLSCYGCRWHQQHMVKSGLNPEYDHRCGHPDVGTDWSSMTVGVFSWTTRHIGDSDRTPSWCPAMKEHP